MFETISKKFQDISRKLFSPAHLTEKNIEQGLQEIRTALLDADVNYKVAKDFIDKIKAKAIGIEVLKSISPAQQIVKIVFDELKDLMGPVDHTIRSADSSMTIIMMVGLQGSGKTTTCAKFARYLREKQSFKPLLVAADIQRPAAIEQLTILGQSLEIPVFSNPALTPPKICQEAVRHAKEKGYNLIILDTAGRLHIDEELMKEVSAIKSLVKPDNIFLVTDAMTGQDAVNSAQEFNARLDIDGVILTKLDGDSRGGAALSIKAVTGKPIKFIGIGEKLDRLEEFHPERMASRILGMGDVVSLVEKAQAVINEEDAMEMQQKFLEASFTLQDFLNQFQMIKKMGNIQDLLGMLPGGLGAQFQNMPVQDKEFAKVEAIISSMTIAEREDPDILDGRRRIRVAKGSGTSIEQVNHLLKQFREMRNMMRNLSSGRMGGMLGNMLGKIPGIGEFLQPQHSSAQKNKKRRS